jgi:hypothetical protein
LGKTVFDFISLAIVKRSSTLAKWMPLAPPLAKPAAAAVLVSGIAEPLSGQLAGELIR